MSARMLLLVTAGVLSSSCIEDQYVPGASCVTSFECPPPPAESDDPVGEFPEQCVPVGNGTNVCVPQPFTRTRTLCQADNLVCLAAGFPVEVQCLPDPEDAAQNICQCPQPLETTCTWTLEQCTCSTAPTPGPQPAG